MSISSKLIKAEAQKLGFDLVGITSAEPHPHFDFFKKWIEEHHYGTMEYLKRSLEKRGNPQKILPEARSVICLGLVYKTDHPRSQARDEKTQGWISNYAWGEDYHNLIKNRLKSLVDWIQERVSDKERFYVSVDTHPILEKSYASSAGLGWIGKNVLLIHPEKGSFFFLGLILTTLKLTPDEPLPDRCGSCTLCIDICPNKALAPYHLEASRCIAYLTLDHKGEISDPKLKKGMGTHLVGCDLCQEVCPWNQKQVTTHEKAFQPKDGLYCPSLNEVKNWDEKTFKEKTKGTPLEWVGFEKWKRNLKIAVENSKFKS